MQVFTVGKNENDMRLDKLIERIIPLAGKSFMYKMLRKKNIVLNDRKAEGSERVSVGDKITFYFSDETFEKFKGSREEQAKAVAVQGFDFAGNIIYEDEDVLLVFKPAGVLSQKAEPGDVSLNEYLIDYLISKGKLSKEQMLTFRPSVCNRLDRNTAGIVCCGVNIEGLRVLSEMFRDRKVHKYYLAICKGRINDYSRSKAYLIKDEKNNTVTVTDKPMQGAQIIETAWEPLAFKDGYSLVEVELFTGKSHQIRAHLASKGYPIAGDSKYGDIAANRMLRDKYRVKSQLLLAHRIVFPVQKELPNISGKAFKVAIPEEFFIKP